MYTWRANDAHATSSKHPVHVATSAHIHSLMQTSADRSVHTYMQAHNAENQTLATRFYESEGDAGGERISKTRISLTFHRAM